MDPKPLVGIPSGFKVGGAKTVMNTIAQTAQTIGVPGPDVPLAKAPAKPKKVKAAKVPAPVPAPAPVTVTVPTPIGEGVPLLGNAGTKIAIAIPAELTVKIAKPITGVGGWQRVMAELKAGTVYAADPGPLAPGVGAPAILTLTPHLLDRLIVLAVKHGSGGYQATIRWVVCLALDQHKSQLMGGK